MTNGDGNKNGDAGLERYLRQIMLPGVGTEGQGRLASGRVLVVGAGGLGSPALMYLAAAGVGLIGIIDGDRVEASNLNRQLLHSEGGIGGLKAESAARFLSAMNPHIKINTHSGMINPRNAMDIIGGYDVVVDCCDSFSTRYLVNDACMLLGKPYVYGSVYRFEGQASVFVRGKSPCYRCLFGKPPPPETAAAAGSAGIIGTVPGVIGVIQANEAIKVLLGIGETLEGRLLVFDALSMSFRTLNAGRDPDCPLCGDSPTITALLEDYDAFVENGWN